MNIGFSTGSIALGDFKTGLSFLKEKNIKVVELSALRENELIEFLKDIDNLDVDYFDYVSFHAPSKLVNFDEHEFVGFLQKIAKRNWLIVVHPDVITDFSIWNSLGELLCIENMDKRKSIGRTVSDLEYIFERLPNASFCFDVAHARQIDSTMKEAKQMLNKFGHRLKQIHLSDVNSQSKHETLSLESLLSYSKLFEFTSTEMPVILESPVEKENLELEIKIASLIFDPQSLINFIRPYSKFSNYFQSYIENYNKLNFPEAKTPATNKKLKRSGGLANSD